MRNKGYITVFLSLVLVAMLVVIYAVIDISDKRAVSLIGVVFGNGKYKAFYTEGDGGSSCTGSLSGWKKSDEEELLMLQPENIRSIEYYKPTDSRLLAYRWDAPSRGVLSIRHKTGYHTSKTRPFSMATVKQQGYQPAKVFYSPQYPDPSAKTRPDHRTTLYWNPKVETDEKGHASVRFYASDISKRYLITLEGVSDDGIVIHKEAIIE